MPKILYVEDELTKNIGVIRKFFTPFLYGHKVVNKLIELESEERKYCEDIVEACKPCSMLDISFTFPDALEKIVNLHRDYDIIIIDRNLSLWDYLADDQLERIENCLQKVGLSFDDERKAKYLEREGDLLLLVLLKLDQVNGKKVYYMTANTNLDMKASDEIQTFIDIGSFFQEQVIEKNASTEEQRLIDVLKDLKSFKIQNDYREQCAILRKHLGEDEVSKFVDLITYSEENRIQVFLNTQRNLLENILTHIAVGMNEPDAEYWNPKNKTQLISKPFIKGFFSVTGEWCGIVKWERDYDIGYTSIIRNFCLSIYEIASDFGTHKKHGSLSDVTEHTIEALKHQICDVILWFDKAVVRIEEVVKKREESSNKVSNQKEDETVNK